MSSHTDSIADGPRKIREIQQPRAHNLATAGVLQIKTVAEDEALSTEISRAQQAGSKSQISRHDRKHARLTRENLAAFDQMAKRKASNSVSASSTTAPTAESRSTAQYQQLYRVSPCRPTKTASSAHCHLSHHQTLGSFMKLFFGLVIYLYQPSQNTSNMLKMSGWLVIKQPCLTQPMGSS